MILAIIVAAFFLRLIALNQSFWLDEGISVFFSKVLSYKSIIFNFSLGDFHPPLYYLVLKFFLQFLPSSEITARLPSVIFGTLTVFIIYLITKKLYDKKTALIAATLLATSPLHIYYSQEARMYAMAAFFTSLSVYFFISIIEKEKILFWAGFILSTVIMLYTDYLPYFMIPTYIFYLLIFRKKIPKPTMISFIPAFILIFIFVAPWLVFAQKQLHTGLSVTAASSEWARIVGAANMKSLLLTFVKFTIGRISIGNKIVYFLSFIPIALYVSLLFAIHFFRLSPKRVFSLFWLFLPIMFAFLISFFIPIYSYFRLLFTIGAFYIILASAINTVNVAKIIRFLLIIALIINTASFSVYFLNSKFHREDWKGATDYIIKNSTSNTEVLFEDSNTIAPFNYYNRSNVKAYGALNNWNPTPEEVTNKLNKITSGKDKIFLFQYLSPITDPQGLVFTELINDGFTNTNTKDFNGVGFVYEFKKI